MRMYQLYVAEFPFAENSGGKFRPVVALTKPTGPYQLLLVAYVTSRRLPKPLSSDVVLDWEKAGLKKSFDSPIAQNSQPTNSRTTLRTRQSNTPRQSTTPAKAATAPRVIAHLERCRPKWLKADDV